MTGQDAQARDGADEAELFADLFVVAIGASAGGLEAIRDLLKAAPKNAPAAFVVAQHMSPHHKSLLTTLIDRETHLEVSEITGDAVPAANTVYVTPPRKDVVLEDGMLRLKEPAALIASPKPSVDRLFRSLADAKGAHAVGVVLSGTGSDGAYGVTAIHDAGGVTIAQHPDTAKYDGMPDAAIKTGCIDLILAPEEIGAVLEKLPGDVRSFQPLSQDRDRDALKAELFQLVLARHHVNFADYKVTTVDRRIERRMAANGLTELERYVEKCRTSLAEIDALYRDMLISVTRFFRDKAEFEGLVPHIRDLVQKHGEGPLRVWVAGCATGEEAYSVAVLIGEAMGGYHTLDKSALQIFATDLDADALAVARGGRYPLTAREDIPAHLVESYFREEGDSIMVRRCLRDVVLFTQHNVFQDPVFMNVDLICCRNLLIYFGTALQDRTLTRFHSALNPEGLLFLGSSESVTVSKDLFGKADNRLNIFRRRLLHNIDYASRTRPTVPRLDSRVQAAAPAEKQPSEDERLFAGLARGLGPAVLMFDTNLTIRRVFGEVTRYLTLSDTGQPTMDYSLLVEPLASDARMLVTMALRSGQRHAGSFRTFDAFPNEQVRLEAYPVIGEAGGPSAVLVSINTAPATPARPAASAEAGDRDLEIGALQSELDSTNAILGHTIEDLRSSNEELQSASEEMQATNEELIAVNEELETSNEELQSTNEELITVNEELQITTAELARLTDEQEAMLSYVGVPLLIVDTGLRVAKASVMAVELFQLATLLEAPHLSQCSTPEGFPRLVPLVEEVLRTGQAIERDIQARDTRFELTISPIISEREQVSGVTIVVSESRQARALEAELRDMLTYAPCFMMHRDSHGRILRLSEMSARSLGTTVEQAEGRLLSEILPAEEARNVHIRDAAFLASGKRDDFLLVQTFNANGGDTVMASAGYHRKADGDPENPSFYVAGSDVTAQLEAQRRAELHARQLEIAARVGGVSHWSIELATQKVFWSPGIYPLHGVTPESYTPELTSAINFYHPDDRQRVTDLVDAAIRKAEPFEFVATLVRADGVEQRVHSACEVTTDPTGKVDSVVGVIRPLD